MRAAALLLATALLAPASAPHADSPVAPAERRGVEQTFLTFPEWFLVHSPAEYARLAARAPPHEFPFVRHVLQLWTSYGDVVREQMRAHYPANPGYHVMILVIATSTTVEYGMRAVYENSFGRLSWLAASEPTAEDRYGAEVAQQYVDFIRQQPWYLFDFCGRLKGLWTEVPWLGPHPLRKWERRYALTTEYAVKALYGLLIEKATRATYVPARMSTQVVADRAPLSPVADVSLVRPLADGRVVLNLPRYFDFRIAATSLAQQGVHLTDIAGNDSVILVTVWCRFEAEPRIPGGRVLFRQALITQPGWQRVALVVPVPQLSQFLLDAPARGATVEHVYDY